MSMNMETVRISETSAIQPTSTRSHYTETGSTLALYHRKNLKYSIYLRFTTWPWIELNSLSDEGAADAMTLTGSSSVLFILICFKDNELFEDVANFKHLVHQ